MGLLDSLKSTFTSSGEASVPPAASFATREGVIYAPVNGVLVNLSEVPDETIASGMLGQGYGIEPITGTIYAPANGRIGATTVTNHSIGMITEDRRGTGILGCLSIADNVSISSLDQYLHYGIKLNKKKIEQLVKDNVAKLSIKTPSSKTLIQSLSGGNQQKVLISRWLANNPDILIMDEPTRGIDVGAKYEIYQIMIDLAKQGKGIIMISSEMPELIGMSNRILVMCNGHITGEVQGEEATQERIMSYATKF